jgi:glycosyltransferase involved in cell wall biosynthesis
MDNEAAYQPTFSVIIPTYNRAEKLKRCLESLLVQTFKNFEIIVCDDGSKDSSAEVVEAFREKGLKIEYIFNENWGGPARPRNIGISRAKAIWICFLDSDDWWYPTKLERLTADLNEFDFICHSFDVITLNGKRGKIRTRVLDQDVFTDLLIYGNSIVTSSVCVKKEILTNQTGFSEDRTLIAVEDFDLWLRIAKQPYKFKVITDCLGAYWAGGGNITATDNRQIERINAVYNKHLSNWEYSEKKRVEARAMQDYLVGWVEHRMGHYRSAKAHYRNAINNGIPIIKLKAFCNLLCATVRYK